MPIMRVDAEWLGAAIRQSRVVALDASHLSNLEAADAFNAALRSFLAAN